MLARLNPEFMDEAAKSLTNTSKPRGVAEFLMEASRKRTKSAVENKIAQKKRKADQAELAGAASTSTLAGASGSGTVTKDAIAVLENPSACKPATPTDEEGDIVAVHASGSAETIVLDGVDGDDEAYVTSHPAESAKIQEQEQAVSLAEAAHTARRSQRQVKINPKYASFFQMRVGERVVEDANNKDEDDGSESDDEF